MTPPPPVLLHRAPASLLEVRGRDRVDLLHRLSTNDLRPLRPAPPPATGEAPLRLVDTLFTTNQGRLVDWVTAMALPEVLLLRASPGRAAALAAWIERYVIMEDVQVREVSDAWRAVALIGPGAAACAERQGMPPAGHLTATAARLDYAGLPAYGPRLELLLAAADADAAVARLEARGARPIDDAAHERLRIAAGVPSPTCEYPGEVNPLELGLVAHAVGWNKGCYIGQEVISRLDSYDKVARRLVGLSAAAPADAAAGGKLVQDGRPLGRVTSWAAAAPGAAAGTGLAVVRRDVALPSDAELLGAAGPIAVRLEARPFSAT